MKYGLCDMKVTYIVFKARVAGSHGRQPAQVSNLFLFGLCTEDRCQCPEREQCRGKEVFFLFILFVLSHLRCVLGIITRIYANILLTNMTKLALTCIMFVNWG